MAITVEARAKASAVETYLHVLYALMLRDMRTRFGSSLWGYGVVVLWPCVHVFMLIAIYTFQKMPVPLGDNRPLFFATGAVPVLMFQYVSREVMKSVITNRPLTYYPQVKLFDLIFSRMLVEVVTGFLSLIVVCGVLISLGVDPRPHDPFLAVCGYLTAILLGIGIGAINVSIISFFPGWLIGYALFSIIIYITSGVIFMPSYMPEKIYYWFKFNPVLQLSEWMRSAYYPSAVLQIDFLYVILCALSCLTIGLFFLKTVVGKTSS